MSFTILFPIYQVKIISDKILSDSYRLLEGFLEFNSLKYDIIEWFQDLKNSFRRGIIIAGRPAGRSEQSERVSTRKTNIEAFRAVFPVRIRS